MNKIKLIATDMDGTLLDTNREISHQNKEMINQAIDEGIEVMVATGRDYTEAVTPLKNAGLHLPLICVNGGDLRLADGEIIHQQFLSSPQFNDLASILKEEDIYYEIYTTKGAYSDNQVKGLESIVDVFTSVKENVSKEDVLKLAKKRFEEGAIFITKNYNDLLQERGVKLFKLLAFTTDLNKKERVFKRLSNLKDIHTSSSGKGNIEISHRLANKGLGVQKMAERLNIKSEEIMVLGDNYNDLSMMKIAGLAVAMENAEEEIKKACDFVTSSCNDNGVAKAIRKIL